jgi:hypothetical protein
VEETFQYGKKGIYLEQKGRNEVEGRSYGKCAWKSIFHSSSGRKKNVRMRGGLFVIAYVLSGCSSCLGTEITGQVDVSSEIDADPNVDSGFDLATETEIDVLADTAIDSPTSDCILDEDIEIDTSQWIFRMGGPEDEMPSHITTDHDGHLLLSGVYKELSGPNSFTWITETDGEGRVIKKKAIRDVVGFAPTVSSSPSPTSIVPLRDCSTLFVGATTAFGSGGMDLWIAKADTAGRFLWQKAIGGPGNERYPAAIETRDGGYLVASMTDSFLDVSEYDLWLVRLESDGSISWQKRIGGVEREWFQGPGCLVETNEGVYYVVVETRSFTEHSDVWVLGLDTSGNLVRQVLIAGGSIHEQIQVFEVLVQGFDLILAGNIYLSPDGNTAWVAKLAPSDTLIWQKAYRAARPSYLRAAISGGDGSFIVTGQLQLETPGRRRSNNWLAAISDSGDVIWQYFISDGVDDWGSDSLAISHHGGIVFATTVETVIVDADNPHDVVLGRLGIDGSFTGDCSLIREAPAIAQDTFAVTFPTTEIPIDTEFRDSEASVSFIDVDMPIYMLCPD